MNSILANIFLTVQNRLKTEVPALKWIDGDYGQLEFYEQRPNVDWPCVLIDIDDGTFSNNGEFSQLGECVLIIRLGLPSYSQTNALTPKPVIELALEYYNLEHAVNKALHGFQSQYFSTLSRVKADKEKRNDNLRVRTMRYTFTYADNTAMPVYTAPETAVDAEILTE
ncbi:hypothetical protein [Pedobacter sp. SL55]|uniref:hypothetical protein n=1 Tax=Pedobacter sp. SL55 TaxID=2995161 RepID=UPI002271316A|nr:hypothetical protein [Pedobacter sp. SL55]WAC40568.1 hypothetical protein OVA16_18685 [Pedobacter sp. SL55]